MPRSPLRSPLPSLKESLPLFRDFKTSPSKSVQIVDSLRPLILKHQRDDRILFHPLREIAAYFKVSIRTAHVARTQLEAEGLLISIRGSHTEIPGSGHGRRKTVQGVVGMPLWMFGMRYSHVHKNLPYHLGEMLWKQNLVLDTIPYSEVEDLKPDFDDHLQRHKMDFAVWLFPFRHNRNAILRLKDSGVRTLLISQPGEVPGLPALIVIDCQQACQDILSLWKNTHGIQRIIIPEGLEYNRGRGKSFARLAQARGFQCQFLPCKPGLIRSLLSNPRSRTERLGIALLDEHATAEFTHGDPHAFSELAKIHRVLFGNNSINLPFIEDNQLTVERIGHSYETLARLVSQTIARLKGGANNPAPRRLICHHDTWRLKRYV